jgi:multidrug efflux system membrane fusion protein
MMNYTEPPSKMKALAAEPRRRFSPRVIMAGVGVLLIAGFFFLRGGEEQAGFGQGGGGFGGRGNQAVPVRIASVETRDIPVLTHTIGTVLANATVAVKSQVEGQLLSANFREGQLVRRGDVLFQIDPRPLEAALRQAEATLARDRAQSASAESDAERAMQLAERGIVSTQQRDQMVAQAKALSATQAANEAALERARLNLGCTTIRAPIDGKTGPLLVHPGNLVRANDANGLVVINQIQPVKVTFALPQTYLNQLQQRMREGALTATIAVHNADGAVAAAPLDESEITVKVDFIGNVVDERTGTIELRATHQNSDMRLVPGELVRVSLHLDTLRSATVVPRAAVTIGQDGNTNVWVLNNENQVQMRPVRVAYQDNEIAAVGNVLQPGQRVVVDGQLRLTEGAAVSIVAPGAVAAPTRPQGAGGQGGGRRGGVQ